MRVATDGRDCIAPVLTTKLGKLYAGDCLILFPQIEDASVDLVFADPPFNIGKMYRKNTNDNKSEGQYIRWCQEWLLSCVRILKPGGSLYLYNIPKWNMILGAFLMSQGLSFRHWIAIEMGGCFPISGKLHPSHYSLLYMSKGPPSVFRKVRTPFLICRNCGTELKDYGGHRKAMHKSGVGLKDVWTDIPVVRHAKYKDMSRAANALSTKLVQRVLNISTKPGNIVLDPFGGSGTTYAVCEKMDRAWIGFEVDYCTEIIKRLSGSEICMHPYQDFLD